MRQSRLIVPNEFKLCATCSYWDGRRETDSELRVVVVEHDGVGECLLHGSQRQGLNDVRQESSCVWEVLESENRSL